MQLMHTSSTPAVPRTHTSTTCDPVFEARKILTISSLQAELRSNIGLQLPRAQTSPVHNHQASTSFASCPIALKSYLCLTCGHGCFS